MPPPDDAGMTPWEAREAEEERASEAERLKIATENLEEATRQADVLRRCGFSTDELVVLVNSEKRTVCVMPRMVLA